MKMKFVIFVFVLLPCLAWAETDNVESQAVDAAKSWLALVDAGIYGRSWENTMVLHISKDQMKRFEEASLQSFFSRAITYLCGVDPQGFGALEEKTRWERMRRIHSQAKGFGAETEREVVLFGEVCCHLETEAIDQVAHPWYYQQLLEPDEDRARTLEYLRDVALEQRSPTGGRHA